MKKLILVGSAIVVLAAGCNTILNKKVGSIPSTQSVSMGTKPIQTPNPKDSIDTSNWYAYTNTQYGFKASLPPSIVSSEPYDAFVTVLDFQSQPKDPASSCIVQGYPVSSDGCFGSDISPVYTQLFATEDYQNLEKTKVGASFDDINMRWAAGSKFFGFVIKPNQTKLYVSMRSETQAADTNACLITFDSNKDLISICRPTHHVDDIVPAKPGKSYPYSIDQSTINKIEQTDDWQILLNIAQSFQFTK